MKIRFADNSEKVCSAPVEQKVFRNGEATGWLISFRILGSVNSGELDTLMREDNLLNLLFLTDTGSEVIALSGYNRVTSCSVRYAESADNFTAEIQLSKGV